MAYLYLVDTRGQKWTDANGLTPALRERGVSNDGYQITRAFPNKKGRRCADPGAGGDGKSCVDTACLFARADG